MMNGSEEELTTWNMTAAPVEQAVPPTPGCMLYKFIMYSIVVGLLCIAGSVGNLVAFVVFWQDKVKTSTSFLFQGLSLIDTVLLLTAIPVYAIPYFVKYTGLFVEYNFVHQYVLVYILPWTFSAQTATIWVTVLVGVNRYIAVCMPYQAPRLCTVVQARKQLAIVLVFSILYNIPRFCSGRIEYRQLNNETVIEAAHTALGKHPLYMLIYVNILYIIFLLVLPLLILTILNIKLINALKELQRKRAEMQSLRQQQDNNVTFVLIIVIIVFTVCQAPALVTQIMWNVLPDAARWCGGVQYYYAPLTNTLVLLNSSVNFVIYFLFNTRFRQVLVQNMCKKREYQRIATATATTKLNNQNPSVATANGEGTQQSLL